MRKLEKDLRERERKLTEMILETEEEQLENALLQSTSDCKKFESIIGKMKEEGGEEKEV